ncbi:MAG: Cell division protein FtsQ [Candidatus Omnitrophica bacterium ADurb.Bin277]|nr:MAG: Cell division protein FtsQ [Candidatus Omnitrophica bacterium ADurb.Bin277]
MGKRKNKNKKRRKGGFFGFWGAIASFLMSATFKLLPAALVVSAFLFGAFGIFKVLYADAFLKVSEVRVVPADVLDPRGIRIIEDRVIGKNILKIDLGKVASQIKLGPGAESVRVIREMPSTIRIEIKKRKPAANILLRPGGPYGVAADDGMIIATSPTFEPAWVLIESFSEPAGEPRIGNRIQNKGFPEALKFLREFESHDLSKKEKVTKISLDAYGNVAVRLGEGPDFQLGRRPSEKFSMLSRAMYLFKTEPRENVEYMDLQFDRIAVKRKKP